MNGALVVLDLGHIGRTGGNPPARGRGHREDLSVVLYAAHAARLLLDAGVVVEIAAQGAYPARRRFARDAGASAYVACHVNAGTKVDYGLLLHTGEERAGSLARSVAQSLAGWCPELRRNVVEPAGPPRWSDATMTLIAGVGCPGLLFEPCSLDRPEHDPLLAPEGLPRIGSALAEGILSWLAS